MPYVPEVTNVLKQICTPYYQLQYLGPYVAELIIAMILFASIIFRFAYVVAVFSIIFGGFIAMLIVNFPDVLLFLRLKEVMHTCDTLKPLLHWLH